MRQIGFYAHTTRHPALLVVAQVERCHDAELPSDDYHLPVVEAYSSRLPPVVPDQAAAVAMAQLW